MKVDLHCHDTLDFFQYAFDLLQNDTSAIHRAMMFQRRVPNAQYWEYSPQKKVSVKRHYLEQCRIASESDVQCPDGTKMDKNVVKSLDIDCKPDEVSKLKEVCKDDGTAIPEASLVEETIL